MGRGGQKLETDIQEPQGFDWDEEGSSLIKSEAVFQGFRHMCAELVQPFPNCNCGPQVSEQVIRS